MAFQAENLINFQGFWATFGGTANLREVLKVLSRTAEDPEFRRALIDLQTEALEPYNLSLEAKSAILSGDLPWLNEHIGEFTQKQLMFILSGLLPATELHRSH
jgi:hypothetical protein